MADGLLSIIRAVPEPGSRLLLVVGVLGLVGLRSLWFRG
ncbi:MAG: PEP-CTERM sorting domain-containing protein [Isosphaeraceae bacterium]|nr:PEP-CTERM sorting domain-containing protein [Isosphaeraceae bacterium]